MERHVVKYEISQVVPYINWLYFFYAWQVSDRAEQQRLKQEAEQIIADLEGRYATHAIVALGSACSDGDDIVFEGRHLPMLRQQKVKDDGQPNLCLADFLRPAACRIVDRMGIFAATVDQSLEKDFRGDDYMRMMTQLIADRLAEATAERLHQEVRKTLWGYAPDENLPMADLLAEKFQGIRPAVGYPSLPDTSLNFIIDEVISMGDIGIRLTESGAMKPHASVSGLMMGHPEARYFNLGKIGADQLADYAQRRQVPVELMRRFLAAVL